MKRLKLLLPTNGFTLIELLLVITVAMVVSTFGVVSFVNYSRNQMFNQAVLNFVNTLNTAKSNAYSQVKPNNATCNSSNLGGYRIITNNPSVDSYTLYAICGASAVNAVTATLPNSSFTITTRTIDFNVLTGGVTGSGDIVITGYGNTKTINVSPAGVIKIL